MKGIGWEETADSNGVATHSFGEGAADYSFWVQGTAEGYVTNRAKVLPGQTTAELQLSPGIPFDVIVVDKSSRQPLEGVEVDARLPYTKNEQLRYRASRTTSAIGRAAFPPAHPNLEVELDLSMKGRMKEEVPLLIDGPGPHIVEYGQGSSLHVSFRWANGTAVEGASLELVGPSKKIPSWRTGLRTDSQGQASVSGLELRDPFYIECENPRARSALLSFPEGASDLQVELMADGASPQVMVRVVDEAGQPWKGVRVRVERRLTAEELSWPENLREEHAVSRISDEEGQATVILKRSGPMTLTLSHGDSGTVVRDFNIQLGETRSFDLVYPRGQTLQGQFVDEEGEPLTNHLVTYKGLSDTTDADGWFDIHGVDGSAGELEVAQRVRARGDQPLLLTRMRYEGVLPGEERQVFHRSAPVRLHGSCAANPEMGETRWDVRFEGGGQYPNNEVPVREGQAEILVASNARPWGVTVAPKKSGSCRRYFPDVSPGANRSVDLGDLLRPSGRDIGGIVRGPDSEPLVGVTVHVHSSVDGWSTETTTDGQGVYLLEDFPEVPGGVYCDAEDGTGRRLADQKQFEASSDSVTLHLHLGVRPAIRGTVVRGDGSPLPHALIIFYQLTDQGDLGWGRGRRTGAQGDFEVRIEPGSYRAYVVPFGTEVVTVGPRVDVATEEDVELRIEVP